MFKRKQNSSISAMTINADIIGINNEYGHFEVGNESGKTARIETDKNILVFKGGILIDILDKGEK